MELSHIYILKMTEEKKTPPEKQISLHIPIQHYLDCKTYGYSYKEVFILGMNAKKQFPEALERIKELEKGNDRLQQKLTRLSERMIQSGIKF